MKNVEVGLRQEQQLKQVMTTELRQAIELLQYTTEELEHFLQEVTLENPFVDRKKTNSDQQSFFSVDQNDAIDYYIDDVPLQEELLKQAVYSSVSGIEQKILQYLIFSLDDNGYLKESIDDVADYFSVDSSQVEKTLSVLQSFDPPGIGARNLQECLLLQLSRLNKAVPLAESIVQSHLALGAEKRWEEISKLEGVEIQDVKEAFQLIQTLNPKPGLLPKQSKASYIIPDLYLEQRNNEFYIHMNPASFPELSINKDYEQMLQINKDKETGEFLSKKYQQVKWIKKGLEQRKQTTYSITKALLKHQRSFFEKGGPLNPLTLKDISKETNYHISTVSRTTRGKFIQTPNGTFELKYFFSSTIQRTDGTTTSAKAVKTLLEDYIHSEDSANPYSDQQIVDYFLTKDIQVSRRTIAKYRSELKILSSTKRKRRM